MFIKTLRWTLSYVIPLAIIATIVLIFIFRSEINNWYANWKAPLDKIITVTEKQAIPVVVEAHNVDSNNHSNNEQEQVVETTEVVSDEQNKDMQTLAQARQAYVNGDLVVAEQHYKNLLDKYPSNPDLWGELGNAQWHMGDREAAANSYYELAKILVSRRQFDRLRGIYPIIKQYAADRAEELDRLIQSEYENIYRSKG